MAEDPSAPEKVGDLAERLDRLERALRDNASRLAELERRLGYETRPAPPSGGPHEAHLTTAATHAAPRPGPAHAAPPPSAAHGPGLDARTNAYGAAGVTADPGGTNGLKGFFGKATRGDLEATVGGSWFNWIGIVALIFGVAFFLKYAFESDWIGPPARVLMGALAGVVFLYLGERLRVRGLRQYAFVLTGGGILILYLSVFAAYAFYGLMGQAPAFLLMAAVTTGAVLLSARHHALPIAVLALIGGFLTPALLSTGEDNQVALFGYVALLDAGVLALAYVKRWRSLNYASFFATAITFVAWLAAHYDGEEFARTFFFLTFFFLLYSALAVAGNLLKRRPAGWLDLGLVVANATFYFVFGYALLARTGHDPALAPFALSLSAFYAGMSYLAWRLDRDARLLRYGYAGAAVTFLTVAFAVRLDQQWVTVAWSMEALMLAWVASRVGSRAAHRASLVVFVVALLHWLAVDAPDFGFRAGVDFVPLANRRAFSCAVLACALFGAARLRRRPGGADDEGTAVCTVLGVAATVLVLLLLTLDVNDFFRERLSQVGPEQAARRVTIENERQFSISALWGAYGVLLFVLGRALERRPLRVMALGLLGLTTLKVFLLDLSALERAYRIVSFIVLGAILMAVSYLYQKGRQRAADAGGG